MGSRDEKKKRGCFGTIFRGAMLLGVLFVLFVVLVGIATSGRKPEGGSRAVEKTTATAPAAQTTPTPAPAVPASPPKPTITVGTKGVLDTPGNRGTYFARDDAYNAMLDAENAASVEQMRQLRDANQVFFVQNGTRVEVAELAVLSLKVRQTDGAFAGREGWVQRDFFRPE